MVDQNLEEIEKKLDIIIKLLSLPLIEGKTKTDSIVFLAKLGFDRNIISNIVGVSPAVVSTRLSESKTDKVAIAGEKNG